MYIFNQWPCVERQGNDLSYLKTLISTCALSTMIVFGILQLGIHCDNALNIGFRSHFPIFPITMNIIGIPFCHSLNTIMVYKGYQINIESMFKLISMKANLYSMQVKFVLQKDSVKTKIMEDDDIPWFDLFQMQHQMKSNSHIQILPSFPIAKWFQSLM